MHLPAEGLELESSASPVRCLPAGAGISGFNTVRRHLSAIRAGGWLQASPARVLRCSSRTYRRRPGTGGIRSDPG